jgi:hypothetical protein
MDRLFLADEPAVIVIAVVDRNAVAVAEVADFGQPAALVVLPLLCRFAVDGAVRQAVCVVVMPLRDQAFVLAADKLSGDLY